MTNKTFTQSTAPESIVRYENVLLLDDNNFENLINKSLMEKESFAKNIMIYDRPSLVIEYLKNAKLEQLPEVIFLDINMPGMDGFQFLEYFAQLPENVHQHCKIIMLSTSESFKDLNRANKNPFVKKFLNKPLTEAVLSAINV